MNFIRRSSVAALTASLIVTALCGGSASAQFNLPGGLDPKRAALGAAARQLAPFITEQTPIKLDPVELYPTVDVLPGAPFAPAASVQAQAIASIVQQLKGSTTGTVSLAPGDYAVAVRMFCMSHARPARSPLAFVLGPMRGKRAPAIIAMNSRAASTPYTFSPLQTTSWTIQGGLGYGDFPRRPESRRGRADPGLQGLARVEHARRHPGQMELALELARRTVARQHPRPARRRGTARGRAARRAQSRSSAKPPISTRSAARSRRIQAADVSTLDSPWSVDQRRRCGCAW